MRLLMTVTFPTVWIEPRHGILGKFWISEPRPSFFPVPHCEEGALFLNKIIPMNKQWFAVGQSLPVLVSLFFVGA